MIFTLTVIGVFGIYFIDKFIQERKKTKRYIQRFKDLMNED